MRLLYSRRGWSYTLATSLVAAVAYLVVGIVVLGLATNGSTGIIGVIVRIITAALLALALGALIAVVADSVRLRACDPAIRAEAASQVSHHPVHSHAFRTPVRHWRSIVFVWALLGLWLLLTLGYLPQQVDSVAYLAGAGKSAMFVGHSYAQECARSCVTVTKGTLLTHPPVSATWYDQAPLGQPFPVRLSVWDGWGPPQLMDGPDAGIMLGFGIFLDLISAGVVVGLTNAVRRWLRRRRGPASPAPASPAPASPADGAG